MPYNHYRCHQAVQGQPRAKLRTLDDALTTDLKDFETLPSAAAKETI